MARAGSGPSLTRMFKKILVAYAGDRAGRDAVALASLLARRLDAGVTVVYPYHPLLANVPAEVAERRARDELRAMLGAADPLPESACFHWSNATWPIRPLHELAEREGSDLIVFGAAPERIGRRRVDLMDRMVHGAPCAVAVAPDGYVDRAAAELRRVGAGFADTPDGRAALDTAFELAKIGGEPLRILAGSGLTGSLVAYTAMSSGLPEAEHEIYATTTAALREIADARAPQERPVVEVRRGDPGLVLAEASVGLDLLVLGSRGYGPVRHVLLGSVSAYVMRHARCPVLVLPRGVAAAAAEDAAGAALAAS